MNNKINQKEKTEISITHCIKIIKRTSINGKVEYVEICDKLTEGYKMLESNGLSFRLDLCKEHFEEFEKKEKEEKAKEDEIFKKTDFKGPECGEPVFNHYHIIHGLHPEYRWFWCRNWHNLYCNNCRHGLDSHGDECTAFFCLNGSGWEPIEKEV